MTNRERFNRVMRYEPVDRLPLMRFEPHQVYALERWRTEGLPAEVDPDEYFGICRIVNAPVDLFPIPRIEQAILSETDTDYVQVDRFGNVLRRKKDSPLMYCGNIAHPVKTIADWRAYSRHYDPYAPGRIPENLDAIAAELNACDAPVGICLFPWFFRLGFYALGMEGFLAAFYEQPALIHEMFGFWSDLVLHTIRPVLEKVKIDVLYLTEDLAYKNAPHVSPRMYEQFWLPYQNPIIEECRRHGVELVCLWTAGNIVPLLPLVMRNGINCTWPLERVAGMDPAMLRKRFGRELRLAGGISKESLITGPEAIDREIEALLPIIREGGFIPALDDMPPAEVPLAHFAHMIDALRRIEV